MNSTSLQYEKLEANLERLRARMPDLPKSSILLSRLVQHIGRAWRACWRFKSDPAG